MSDPDSSSCRKTLENILSQIAPASDDAEIRGEALGQYVYAQRYVADGVTRRIVTISWGYDAFSVEFTSESLYQSLEEAIQAAKEWLAEGE